MLDGLNQYFQELLTALRDTEKEHVKRYIGAIDIEDMDEAVAVSVDARTKIRRLRKCAEDVRRINDEIEAVFPISFTTPPEPIETTGDIVTQPAQAIISEESTAAAEAGIEQAEDFAMLEKRYSAAEWQEILNKVCETMILKQPYKFAYLGTNLHSDPALSFDDEGRMEASRRLPNGLFVDTGGSESELKARCEYILSGCGYSSEEFQIL